MERPHPPAPIDQLRLGVQPRAQRPPNAEPRVGLEGTMISSVTKHTKKGNKLIGLLINHTTTKLGPYARNLACVDFKL